MFLQTFTITAPVLDSLEKSRIPTDNIIGYVSDTGMLLH